MSINQNLEDTSQNQHELKVVQAPNTINCCHRYNKHEVNDEVHLLNNCNY